MTAHLTRRIVRSILAEKPIVYRGCLRRRSYSALRTAHVASSRRPAPNGNVTLPLQSRRTIFNLGMFSSSKKKEAKDADMDPGIETMMEFVKRQRMKARLPQPQDVASSLKRFLAHRRNNHLAIEDTQAELALASLQYCLSSGLVPPSASTIKDISQSTSASLTSSMLRNACEALAEVESPVQSHVELAKLLFEVMPDRPFAKKLFATQAYVHCLALSGHAHSARELVLQTESGASHPPAVHESDHLDLEDMEQPPPPTESSSSGRSRDPFVNKMGTSMWIDVLGGFARQGDEEELLNTVTLVRGRNIKSSLIPLHMLRYYLRGDDMDAVKTWFAEYWQSNVHYFTDGSPKGPGFPVERARREQLVNDVLRWCLKNDKLEFGHQIVRQALDGNPSKGVWDAVFVWAAGTGKGADEIDRMFTVMESANKTIADRSKWCTPDIATINALVEYATSKNDPYLAERFIAVGKARGIHADAYTYVLQIKYRLKISDIDGALIAYKSLQSMDLSSNEDIPTVNELIVALCRSKRHDFDTIMNIAADMSDRRARFEPATTTALALLHLDRDEVNDVTDLMNTHAYHYSGSERDLIRRSLIDYSLARGTPLSRVWDAYNVLSSTFDEMPRDDRTQLMQVFYKGERADVAVHIFNAMRSHYREDTIPTIDTYVAAFLGSARLRDLDSLEAVHNQLKLDTNINTNTYLLNGLMIGYSACGNPRRALTFWDDIVASKEGPTYNSIHIALRACEKSPFGDVKAENIWGRLRRMTIDLDQALWASYIAALAGNGKTEKAISTLEEAETSGELNVDSFVVGSLFTACPGQSRQGEVESWCKQRHPEVWEELEKIGMDENENGTRVSKIDRTVTP